MTYVIPIKTKLSAIYNQSTYEVDVYNSIISTDATDAVTTEWDNVSSFTQGQFVQVSGLKRIYRCASASSIDQYPPSNPTVFTDYGATNSYKMFDDVINSQTKFTTACNVSLTANSMNTLSLLNMSNVNSVRVVQTDNATSTVVFDKTYDLTDYGVSSLYDYWYQPIRYKQDLVIKDLYFIPDAKIDITFSSTTDGLVGAVVSGLAGDLGMTLYGSSVKLNDYSKYVVDEYGNTTFSKRGYARTVVGNVVIDNNLINDTVNKLAELRGSITLFIGDESENGYSVLTTLGYIKDINMSIQNPTKTKYPITIIGVI